MKSDRQRLPATTGPLVASAASGCLAFAISLAATLQAAPAEPAPAPDLLRFLNGDSLHGTFLGMTGDSTLSWKHSDTRTPIVLDTAKLRHLALHGGRARLALRSASFVLLNDGDRLPGTIVSLDREKLILDTEMSGTLSIPRQAIRQIAPNPHGGALHYVGPFAPEDWTVLDIGPDPAAQKGEAALDPDLLPPPPPEEDPAVPPPPSQEGRWVFSGGAYYSNSQAPIVVDAHTPDKARIQFRLAWRNRFNAAIAFHATMEPPQPPPAEPAKEGDAAPGAPAAPPQRPLPADGGSPNGFAQVYGQSYVLTLYSNYAQLFRCSFTKEGEPQMERLPTTNANLRLEESGEADFELRCDRSANSITLFADGRYISQWDDPQGYAGTGTHLAFACQSSSSRLRVSDVIVTSWNGMIDSARSMEAEDRDIILLANGMDRFSGKVVGLADGKFQIEGTYAGMQIPLEEVQEIRLGGSTSTEATRGSIRVLLQPFGRLTLLPLEATSDLLKARHASLGDLSLDLRYSGLLGFSTTGSILDSWDDDF